MHIQLISKPAQAFSIEVLLDIINQIIGTVSGLEQLMRSIGEWLGKGPDA